MSSKPQALNSAETQGESFTQTRQFEWLARGGLAARGVIYAIIGGLALQLALGDSGGSTTSQQGALREIAQQPFGEFLLILMAIGLAGYAIWKLVRAAIGHGKEATDSTTDRVSGAVSGILYAALCVTAVSILIGSQSSSGSSSQSTGGVLGWPGGVWIVGIAGAIVVGAGLNQIYQGLSKGFLEKSKTEQMSPEVKRAFTIFGVVGYVARGVVFALIGYFLIKAAIDFNPDAAVTIDAALSKVAQASYGSILLGLVSAGLIGFGLYSFADARYRRV